MLFQKTGNFKLFTSILLSTYLFLYEESVNLFHYSLSVSFDTGSAFDVQNLSHAVSRIWEGIIVPFCIADYCLVAEPFDGEMVADDYEIPVIFVIKYVLLHTFIDRICWVKGYLPYCS